MNQKAINFYIQVMWIFGAVLIISQDTNILVSLGLTFMLTAGLLSQRE